jgi:hypothetical protein
MRKEGRLLKEKAVETLILGIETFNRPFDRGRTDRVLRDLSHAFEMLIRALSSTVTGESDSPERRRPSSSMSVCARA